MKTISKNVVELTAEQKKAIREASMTKVERNFYHGGDKSFSKTKVWSKWNEKTESYKLHYKNLNDGLKLTAGTDYSKKLADRKTGKPDYKAAGCLQSILTNNVWKSLRICRYDEKEKTNVPVHSRREIWEIVGYKEAAGKAFVHKLINENQIIAEVVKTVKLDGKETKVSDFYINPLLVDGELPMEAYQAFREVLVKHMYENDVIAMDRIYNIINSPAYNDMSLEEAIDTDPKDLMDVAVEDSNCKFRQMNLSSIFNKTVLRGQAPQFVTKDNMGAIKKSVRAGQPNVFFMVQEVEGDKRNQDAVSLYRNIAIDIDLANKGENVKRILIRKRYILRRLNSVLPTPTAIVDSRNGFHIYWSIEPTSDKAEWEEAASCVKNLLNGIIDPCVTTDAARVLRYPNTWHKKPDSDPYYVKIKEANDIIYKTSDLVDSFKKAASRIKETVAGIMADYPVFTSKSTHISAKKQVTPEFTSARIEAIKNLSTDTFQIPSTMNMMTKEESKYHALYEMDLADFLQVNGSAFDCIFHKTEGGDGKSATIYAPHDGYPYTYQCHCLEKPYDILNIVQELAGCDYAIAIQYLNKLQNIVVM